MYDTIISLTVLYTYWVFDIQISMCMNMHNHLNYDGI